MRIVAARKLEAKKSGVGSPKVQSAKHSVQSAMDLLGGLIRAFNQVRPVVQFKSHLRSTAIACEFVISGEL